MSNLEVGLIVFIFTHILIARWCASDCVLVSKKQLQNCKIISFEDGSTWIKSEVKDV